MLTNLQKEMLRGPLVEPWWSLGVAFVVALYSGVYA